MSKQALSKATAVDWQPEDLVLRTFALEDDTRSTCRAVIDSGNNFLPQYLSLLSRCRSRRRSLRQHF
nr:Spa2 [Serratia entomophila]ULG11956.1 Spa2 [Serratia entomophila]ULG12516.1 Spa2 [Serratia entomophila]